MPPPLPTALLNTITSHTGPINALTFSSQGGTYILTGSSDRSIHLSRTIPTTTTTNSSSQPQSSPPSQPIQSYLSHGYPILSLTCSPTNTTFASSSAGDREPLFLWDVSAATTLRRFSPTASHAHTARINSVTFAGDGGDAVLISGSNDTTVRVWDVRSRSAQPVMVLSEAKDAVSVVVSVAGESCEILAGSVDGRLRSYDVRTGKCTVDRLPAPVGGLCLTRDGKIAAVGTLDGKLRMLERATGTCLQSFPPARAKEEELAEQAGNDGAGYANTSIRLRPTFGGVRGSESESLLLSGSEADGRVRAWDVLTGRECASVEPPRLGPSGATNSWSNTNIKTSGEKAREKDKVPVISVVEWRGASGAGGGLGGSVWACGGVGGRVWVYGTGGEE